MVARLGLIHSPARPAVTARATRTAVIAAMLALSVNVLDRRPQAGGSFTAGSTVMSAIPRVHLGARSTLRDLLRHPAFAGFAPLILPWDDRAYDEQMPLARIGSLLGYSLWGSSAGARMAAAIGSYGAAKYGVETLQSRQPS